MLTASNVPQTGFIYTIPTTMMSLMPRSFKTSEMSTAANYTLLVNDSPIASSTSTFVNLPVMALRGGDVITLTHDSSLTFDFQIFASPVYSVEIIKLN